MERLLRVLHGVLNHLVLIALVGLALLAWFLVRDTDAYFDGAAPDTFAMYRPGKDNSASFRELQAKNPDVLGWLTFPDTGIDYPLVQHENDNSFYLNHNAAGEPSPSGSLFLDVRSDASFADFNSLVYGHYMEGHHMLGDLKLFLDEDFFKAHDTGLLYYGGATHGLRVLSIAKVSAYDEAVYRPHVPEAESEAWVSRLERLSVNLREHAAATDRLVLLSSCAEDMTSGRYALLCRLTETAPELPERSEGTGGISPQNETKSGTTGVAVLTGLTLLTAALYAFARRRDKRV